MIEEHREGADKTLDGQAAFALLHGEIYLADSESRSHGARTVEGHDAHAAGP
jgi:hypothetical protein